MEQIQVPPEIKPQIVQANSYQQPRTNWPLVITIILVMTLSGCAFAYLTLSGQKGNSNSTNQPIVNTPSLVQTNVVTPTTDQASIIKSWQTFDNLRQALKNHDVASYNTLIAVPEPFCKTLTSDCTQLMDTSYDYLSKYQQADFVNIVEDNKQLALWNNPTSIAGSQYEVVYLYFTKNSKGDLDFLSVDDKTFDAASQQDAIQHTQELKTAITQDTDGNGYWDVFDKIWNQQMADAQQNQNNTTSSRLPTPTKTSPTPTPTPPANNPPSSGNIVSPATDQISVRFDYYFQIFIQAWKNKNPQPLINIFGYASDYGQNSWDFKDDQGIWAFSKYVIYKSKVESQTADGVTLQAYYVVPDKQDSSKYNILIISGNYNDTSGTARITQEQVFPSYSSPKKYSTKDQIDKDINFFMK